MNRIEDIYVTDGAEPITLQQFKDFHLITTEDRDAEITILIGVARRKIEQYTTVSLVAKDIILTCYLDCKVLIPFPVVDEITEVKILTGTDGAGVNTWEVITNYQVTGNQLKYFVPHSCGTYEITYSTLPFAYTDLLHDVYRVGLWLLENKGDDSDNIPKELYSSARNYKIWV